jgi:hypothetical protein
MVVKEDSTKLEELTMSTILLPHGILPLTETSPEQHLGLIPAARLEEFRISEENEADVVSFSKAVDRYLHGALTSIRRVHEQRWTTVAEHTEVYQNEQETKEVKVRSLIVRKNGQLGWLPALSVLQIEGSLELYGEAHLFLGSGLVDPETVKPLEAGDREYMSKIATILLNRTVQNVAGTQDLV